MDKQQEQKPQQEQQQQKAPVKKMRDVFVEIAGGYLLGATIMSFLGLWTIGLINL